MFITIHGIDGTGKTTATHESVRSLTRNHVQAETVDDIELLYGAEYPFPDEAEAERSKTNISILKKVRQSKLVDRALSEGTTVLKDRWLIDVYANAHFKRADLPAQLAERVLRPHLSVLLVCDEDVRQQRIAARGNPTPEDLVPKQEGSRAEVFENYLLHNLSSFAVRAAVIDTTRLTPSGVAEHIVDNIRGE